MRSFALLAPLLVAGCVTPGLHQVDDQRLIGLAWPYAQVAYNSYHTGKTKPADRAFRLPSGWRIVETQGNDDIGLAFDIYKREPTEEYVVVFRGTEGLPTVRNCDWKHGNLSLHQQERAVGHLRAWMKARDVDAGQMTLVGHSLGGAIAIHASYRLGRAGPHVFVFNSSPQFRRPRADPVGGRAHIDPSLGRRFAFARRGEFLYLARGPGREPNQVYLPVTCSPSINPFSRHSMRALAACLTKEAANAGDPTAAQSLETNASMLAKDDRDEPFPPCGYIY